MQYAEPFMDNVGADYHIELLCRYRMLNQQLAYILIIKNPKINGMSNSSKTIGKTIYDEILRFSE